MSIMRSEADKEIDEMKEKVRQLLFRKLKFADGLQLIDAKQ